MNPLPSMHTAGANDTFVGFHKFTSTSQPKTCPLMPFVPTNDTRWPVVASNSNSPILLAVAIVTGVPLANGMRPDVPTSTAAYGGGGMMKSPADTAVPSGVKTVIWPEPLFGGTATVSVVDVAVLRAASRSLNRVLSFARIGSKFVPVTVTALPATPTVGVNPVTVGAPFAPTVNVPELVAEPAGALMAIVPEVAPAGTVTTSWFAVALETVAAVPLNVTVF